MRTIAKEVGFAIAAWIIPLVISICIYRLKQTSEPLFNAMMGIVLTGTTVSLALWYLRLTPTGPVKQGIKIGLVWMIASWLLDSLMFSHGPMQMSLYQYVTEIGAGYFVIPIITVGLGLAAARPRRGVDR
jgi:hypothetical protein